MTAEHGASCKPQIGAQRAAEALTETNAIGSKNDSSALNGAVQGVDLSRSPNCGGGGGGGESEIFATADHPCCSDSAFGQPQQLTQAATAPAHTSVAAVPEAANNGCPPAVPPPHTTSSTQPDKEEASRPQMRVRLPGKRIRWHQRQPLPRHCNARATQRAYPTRVNDLQVGDRLMVDFYEDGSHHWYFGCVAKLHTASLVWHYDGGGEDKKATLKFDDFETGKWRIPAFSYGPLPPPGSFMTANFVTIVPDCQLEYRQEEQLRAMVCTVCRSRDFDSKMVICETFGCDAPYHIWCMDPPMLEMPAADDTWLCPKCQPEGREQHQRGPVKGTAMKVKVEEALPEAVKGESRTNYAETAPSDQTCKRPPPTASSSSEKASHGSDRVHRDGSAKRPREDPKPEGMLYDSELSSGLSEWLKTKRRKRKSTASSSTESFQVQPKVRTRTPKAASERRALKKHTRPEPAKERNWQRTTRRRCNGIRFPVKEEEGREMEMKDEEAAQQQTDTCPAPLATTVATPPSAHIRVASPNPPSCLSATNNAANNSATAAVAGLGGTQPTTVAGHSQRSTGRSQERHSSAAALRPSGSSSSSSSSRGSSSSSSSSSSTTSSSLTSLQTPTGAGAALPLSPKPAAAAVVGTSVLPPSQRPVVAPVKTGPKRNFSTRAALSALRPATTAHKPACGAPTPRPSPAALVSKAIDVDGLPKPTARTKPKTDAPVWSLLTPAESRLTSNSLEPISGCSSLDKHKRVRNWLKDLFFDGSDPSSLVVLD